MSDVHRILLVAALPQEYAHLTKITGPWKRFQMDPFSAWKCCTPDREMVLVETGMGRRSMLEGMQRAIGTVQPDLIICFGFGGGLSERLEVGQVNLVRYFVLWNDAGSFDGEEFYLEPSSELLRFCSERRVGLCRSVTVGALTSKPRLSESVGRFPAVVDMESYHAARIACDAGIPLLCIRAISDGLNDEIDFDLSTIADDSGQVKVGRVLLAVLRRPSLAGSFYRAWRRSRWASIRLGEILAALLDIPGSDITWLTAGGQIGKRKREEIDGV